jgi:hypothetical protein
MRIIRITSTKDGINTLDLTGFVGEACVRATEEFERRLGLRRGERELKPEFRQSEPEPEVEPESERS